jgi:hypothetical protein
MEVKLHPFQYGKKGWVDSRAITGQVLAANVDAEKGILYDVVLCQAMQPRGMAGIEEWTGARIETPLSFIEKLVELAGAFGENGHQARFGHPNDCNPALGTYAGRIKNVRLRGNQAIGDIYLSEASAQTPGKGDLKGYILKLAKEDSQALMMSIVFSPGHLYMINADGHQEDFLYDPAQIDYLASLPEEERVLYETVRAWHFTDFVDQGANTLDMFRDQNGNISIAARATDFLDNHPEIWDLLISQPQVMEEFTRKYEAHRARKNTNSNTTVNKNQSTTASLLDQLKGVANSILGIKNVEDAAPAEPVTDAAKTIENTTADGAAISIDTDAETPAVGDQVTLAGGSETPPAGEHTLTGALEGWVITTDEAGLITAVVEPAAETADDAAEPVAASAHQEATDRNLHSLAEVLKSQSQILEQVTNSLKSIQADMSRLKESPLMARAFADSGNRITSGKGSDAPETEWAKLQREINERKAAQAQK